MSEFERIKNKIQNQSNKLPSQWIQTEYIHKLERKGIKNNTKAGYLKALRKIYLKEETNPQEIKKLTEDELRKLNLKVQRRIQNSQYKIKDGELTVRRKRQQWRSWKDHLQALNIDTSDTQNYMPEISFTKTKNSEDITQPEDLPTRSQMKQFCINLRKNSHPHTATRNQALAMLLWDKGPRIGEALCIKIKHIQIQGKQVKIKIPGNKGSDTRKVELFQGRHTIKKWIQEHPARENKEAYLFPPLQNQSYTSQLDRNSLSTQFHRAASNLDFKTRNEPFHIFRKAMVSFHIVNEYATWEQVCKWHGKKTNSTKPDYLKMALSDVDASVASKMGVKDDVDRERDNEMLGKPLLPVECTECSSLNKCFHEICNSCGNELPENELPNHLDTDDGQNVEKAKLKATYRELESMLEKAGVNKKEVLDE